LFGGSFLKNTCCLSTIWRSLTYCRTLFTADIQVFLKGKCNSVYYSFMCTKGRIMSLYSMYLNINIVLGLIYPPTFKYWQKVSVIVHNMVCYFEIAQINKETGLPNWVSLLPYISDVYFGGYHWKQCCFWKAILDSKGIRFPSSSIRMAFEIWCQYSNGIRTSEKNLNYSIFINFNIRTPKMDSIDNPKWYNMFEFRSIITRRK